jgi:hypothetical protein
VLEEISPEGATLLTECAARKGSKVNLGGCNCELHGKVVGCHATEGGYITEVDFPAKEAWSLQRFRPEQLFDPRSLTCKDPMCSAECTGDCGMGGASDETEDDAAAAKIGTAELV